MNLNISARTVITTMTVFIGCLVVAHSIQAYLDFVRIIDYIAFLDLDVEGNLPTFYSAFAIELCALLLFTIYRYNRHIVSNQRAAWLGLTIVFAFLGIDEATRIHEDSGDLLASLVSSDDGLDIPWLVPYGTAVVIFVALYLKWLFNIPVKSRVRFIIAGAVFLSGAAGMEIIGSRFPDYELGSLVSYTLEETLEMLGIALFARALILHIAELPEKLSINFTE